MSNARKKVLRIVNLILGVVLCILSCIGGSMVLKKLGDGSSQSPLKSFILAIDKNKRDELYTQLGAFADKHYFDFTISDYGTSDENVQVWMAGEKIKIIASVYPATPNKFFINFYATSPGAPLPEEDYVNYLLDDLKGFLYKIPNIEISEE